MLWLALQAIDLLIFKGKEELDVSAPLAFFLAQALLSLFIHHRLTALSPVGFSCWSLMVYDSVPILSTQTSAS